MGNLGKIQIELEKNKWELKSKYNELGKYVSDKKISNSVTDFTHESHFLELVNHINKLKLYIYDLEMEKKKVR